MDRTSEGAVAETATGAAATRSFTAVDAFGETGGGGGVGATTAAGPSEVTRSAVVGGLGGLGGITSCFTESVWAASLAFGSINAANDFAYAVRLRPSADALDINDFAAKDISTSGSTSTVWFFASADSTLPSLAVLPDVVIRRIAACINLPVRQYVARRNEIAFDCRIAWLQS